MPVRRRQYRPTTVRVPKGAHPLVRTLFAAMQARRMSQVELAERSGVDRNTIRSWQDRNTPTVINLAACLEVLGMRLVAVPVGMVKTTRDDHANGT